MQRHRGKEQAGVEWEGFRTLCPRRCLHACDLSGPLPGVPLDSVHCTTSSLAGQSLLEETPWYPPWGPPSVTVQPGRDPPPPPPNLSTGDYFGILMEARVTTFPFNILDNPMYWGSTANYLGWAIM